MAFTTLSLGLTLTIPTNGTRAWGTTMFNTTWTKISQHGHTGSGDGNQVTAAGIADFTLTLTKFNKAHGFYQNTISYTPAGTTSTINFNNGSINTLNVGSATGNVTVTLSNPVTSGSYKLFIVQGATARDVIWPASVKWPQGQAPILSTVNGSIDIVDLYYDGTNYYGTWELDFL